MDDFLIKEPAAKAYFKPWYGSDEFINCKPRYCLWLGDCSPAELRKMPQSMKQIEAVREFRLKSKSEGTRKLADKPTRFHVENMPVGNYIVIPKVSSERRRYIPIGYMDDSVLASDLVFLIPDAGLYHFGILTSNVHNSWMRAVCGRLEMRYRYSKDIVYNNFPWPNPTATQKEKIEKTAQSILDIRTLHPECTLADLYDVRSMPQDLLNAHRANDKAVLEAYGFWGKFNSKDKAENEAACVTELMKMYQKLVEQQ